MTLTSEGVVTFANKADQSLSHELDGSTGLGLSIAKLLTERMGGTINAEYKNGELYITVQFP